MSSERVGLLTPSTEKRYNNKILKINKYNYG
jgi:hypothetical protein